MIKMAWFGKCDAKNDRVKKLFRKQNLKNLNNGKNLCAKFTDFFYLDDDKFTTADVYKHVISGKPNFDITMNILKRNDLPVTFLPK